MSLLAPHTRLTPTQALFWLRHCGGQVERVGRRWNLTWQGRMINADHAALCASAERDRAQTLQAQPQHDGPLVVTALVACVGEKRTSLAPAQDLYQSPWFRKARAYAERYADRWFILSALYGLIAPDEIREPYNVTLNTMKAPERFAWAERVWPQILAAVPDPRRYRIVFLAGKHYRHHLAERLLVLGYDVEVPMEGLGIGEQLAWMDRAAAAVQE
jgi:hypothetical protein